MNWLETIRLNHSLKMFRKRTKKVHFTHDFVDLEHAKKIGFIINMGEFTPKELIVLTDYITKLEDHGKTAFVVEVNMKRKAEPMFNETVKSVFLGAGDVSWLGFPSLEKMKKLNEAHCDILMDLDTTEKMTSRFICGLSNARTRVGRHQEGFEEYYELMLQVDAETPLREMLSQYEQYLKMLEK